MADRFWVPNGDTDFHSTTNWSLTSGGASGASVPTTGDTAKFDANSGEYVPEISAPVLCHIDTTGILPNFGMVVTTGGSLSLQEDLVGLYALEISGSGSLTTNNYNITTTDGIDFKDTAVVTLGTSILSMGANVVTQSIFTAEAGATLDADESTINFYMANEAVGINDSFFESHGHTFGAINLYIYLASTTPDKLYVDGTITCGTFSIIGDGDVVFDYSEPTADVITITGASGLTLQGTTSGGLSLDTVGDPYTFSMAAGTCDAVNITIANSIATGGATFNAPGSSGCVDGGGNTGWLGLSYVMNGLISFSPEINSELHNANMIMDGNISIVPQFTSEMREVLSTIESGFIISPELHAELRDNTVITTMETVHSSAGPDTYLEHISISPQLQCSLSTTTMFPSTMDISLPELQFSLYGGGYLDFSVPKLLFSMHGSTDFIGRLNINLPSLLVSLSALQEVKGNLAFSLPSLQFGATGIISEVSQLNIVLPKLSLNAHGVSGLTGQLNIVLPAMDFVGTAYWSGTNTLDIVLPALQFTAHVISDDFLILVLNTKNFALTEYDNYDYNSLFNYNGKLFGAKADGIYELTGDTDDGDIIDWEFKTGKLDLEDGLLRKARHVWLSYKPSGDLILSVDDGENEYEYAVESCKQIDNAVRIKLGKGIRNRYIQLGLRNVANEKITLDRMRLFAEPIGKKR